MRLAVTRAIVVFAAAITAASAAPKTKQTVAGLDAEVHASWTQLPLSDWATRMSSLAGRPVILDRRMNPELPVTLTARGETLRAILARVAADAGGVVDELESTIRIVPHAVAGKAARADADRRLRLAKATQEVRRRLTDSATWTWPTAARPRDLVEGLVSPASIELKDIDTIPHDHFQAADLPRLSLAERLDLVLAHFDRRVVWTEIAGKPAGRIVAIDAELLPDVASLPTPPRATKPTDRTRTVKVRDEFTLRLEAPLDQALMAIARQLDLEIDVDRASLVARGIALGEIVRADVTKVSREALFDAILQPLGLAWQLEGRRLRVFAPVASE